MPDKYDKYDKAIDYLTENPDKIYSSWNFAGTNNQNPIASCLFDSVGPFLECGCLTQVKYDGAKAASFSLARDIYNDNRIPKPDNITVEDLPVFAEWQRRIDKELGRS